MVTRKMDTSKKEKKLRKRKEEMKQPHLQLTLISTLLKFNLQMSRIHIIFTFNDILG